jgi:hypothetical protein
MAVALACCGLCLSTAGCHGGEGLKGRGGDRPVMSEDLKPAVESFLDDVDLALHEYEEGYADADATLTVIQSHLTELEAAVEEA